MTGGDDEAHGASLEFKRRAGTNCAFCGTRVEPFSRERNEQTAARRRRRVRCEKTGWRLLQHRPDFHPALVAARPLRNLQVDIDARRVFVTRQPNRASDTRPAASTRTPSRSSSRRWVIPAPLRASSRLSRPCALITRCQGSLLPGGSACSAYPTSRGCPGIPAILATLPYVVTRPRGIFRTAA